MRKIKYKIGLSLIFIPLIIMAGLVENVSAGGSAQQPTGSIPTVTGTDIGPTITVNADNEQINVRNGPGTEYNLIGVLISGQVSPAIGKSAAGLWIQIVYPGIEGGIAWVYSPLVTVSGGDSLPIVEPPPKPEPLVSPTIDPTLAAQFIIDSPPTRLPTFTAPPPVIIPTYVNQDSSGPLSAFPPMGLLITLFGMIGIIGTLISFTRRR